MSRKSEKNHPQTLSERITSTPEGMRVWQQERVIFDTSEDVCQIMEDENISRKELARRLGVTPGYVSQLLDGETNMTLRTASDVFVALGKCMYVIHGPLAVANQPGVSARIFMPIEFEKPTRMTGSGPRYDYKVQVG